MTDTRWSLQHRKRSGRGQEAVCVAEPPRQATCRHVRPSRSIHRARARPAGLYGYMKHSSIAAILTASSSECAPFLNTDESVASHGEIGRCEPHQHPVGHDSLEHDDMVVKADGRSRGASMAVLAPGSLRGASGRCHARNCSESQIGSGHKPLFRSVLKCISVAYRAVAISRLK
jgi:hypothetical protein